MIKKEGNKLYYQIQVWYWILAVVVIISSFISGEEWGYYKNYLLFTILIAGISFFFNSKRLGSFQIFYSLIIWINIVYYCYQPFLPISYYESKQLNLIVRGTEESRIIASISVFIGIVFFIFGILFRRLFKYNTQSIKKEYIKTDANRVIILFAIILVIKVVSVGLKIGIDIAAFVAALDAISYFCIGILYVKLLNNELSRVGTNLFAVGLIYILSNSIAIGAVAELIKVLLFLLYLYINLKKKMPSLAIIIVGALLSIVPLMFKGIFRSLTWMAGHNAMELSDIITRLISFYDVVAENFDFDQIFELLNLVGQRFGMFHIFEYVVALTPDFIPYWGGYSYYPLLFKLIPRFLFENKPVEDIGQVFGHQYNFLLPFDLTTSINLPTLIEFYLNFGILGVALGMFLLGIIFGMLFAIVEKMIFRNDSALAAKSIIFINLANIESNFSLVFGGLPLLFLSIFIADRILHYKIIK